MTTERISVVAPARQPDAVRTADPPPSAMLRLYPALGNSNFRLLWLGGMPATLAVMMNQVASPYAAFTLSNSAAILGIVSLAQALPMLALSLVGGVAAHRLPRRFVLIGSQMPLGLAAAALFRLPGTPRPEGPTTRAGAGSAAHLLEGLRYVRSNPPIMALIAMNLIVVVFGQPYQTLMPVVSERVFSAGAEGLGLLMAGSGAGALTGAVIVASMSRLRRPATIQVGLAIALGLALVGFSMTRSFPVALALLVVVGFLFSSFSALNNTLLMANTEPRLTGRVMSIYLLTWGAMPIGSLPLAWLAERAGAPLALMVSGGLVTALAVAVAVLFPAGRRIGWARAAVLLVQPARPLPPLELRR